MAAGGEGDLARFVCCWKLENGNAMHWHWWSPTDRETASRLTEQDGGEYVRLGGYSSVVGPRAAGFVVISCEEDFPVPSKL
ncbi:uncharacterized protein CLUP02_07921 [Colletotrichum lupini]|uniref:Uncharacterized protein n=1 Tax=Colletotrichum lupini TaxID=145971 RepID=A0A9Q8WG47_9PEZI|nr:uncharacterized protein CLUP02_07921 [Colletotrichum lupini]KAI3550311.1 hypothetical protein CSPX01_01909 [Colletotrichum filicis]UQC82433.1 hypothetical protein CLUP02_07921 [Colletotrichum lupini]